MGNPDLIILDEPLSGLDHEGAGMLKKCLLKKKEEGLSIMISTHQPEFFMEMANQHLKL
ncbi:MAG TPA: hypothetical protein DDW82_04555 [Acholeplasmataceae bacterium]|nr:hypothetical protein [Acholeplasmataceae bacterium]